MRHKIICLIFIILITVSLYSRRIRGGALNVAAASSTLYADQAAAITDGLQNYWKFDGDYTDELGNDNFTTAGAVTLVSTFLSGFDTAANQDGAGVQCQVINWVSPDTIIIGGWIQVNDNTVDQGMVGATDSDNQHVIVIRWETTGTIQMFFDDSGGDLNGWQTVNPDSYPMATGDSFHFVLELSMEHIQTIEPILYINGTQTAALNHNANNGAVDNTGFTWDKGLVINRVWYNGSNVDNDKYIEEYFMYHDVDIADLAITPADIYNNSNGKAFY